MMKIPFLFGGVRISMKTADFLNTYVRQDFCSSELIKAMYGLGFLSVLPCFKLGAEAIIDLLVLEVNGRLTPVEAK